MQDKEIIMETIRSKGFTAKDEFNSASSIPIKEVKDTVIEVEAILAKEKPDGQPVAHLKTTDGKIYATISSTLIEQMPSFAVLLEEAPQKVLVKPMKSNAGREYFMLELQ